MFVQCCILLALQCTAYAINVPRLAGKFSHDVDVGHLIVPRRVHSNGSHFTYNVTHFHDFDSVNEIDSEQQDKLHYHIDLHDETLHVELKPSLDFMGPSMVVERHRRDTRSRAKYKHHHRRCHFQGQVRDDHSSNVALSTCNGISGILRTKRGDYYIEPSKHHQMSDAGHYPHIIFQRSAIKQQPKESVHPISDDSDINVKSSSSQENIIFNSKENSLRKRKKHRNPHLKKHEASNCGTKEPKRPSETHIEWRPQGKLIVQNSRKIRNRIRKKYFRDLGKQRRRQRRRKLRLHRAKKLEQNLNRHKDLTSDEVDDVIDYQVQRRSKRSVSSPRHVEALVVADPSMVAFHQDGDVEMYLLTIMNMVSSLYKDPAIGNLIKVVVIRIVLLEEEDSHPDFNVTHAAEGNLRNFCRWQRMENPKDDSDPTHHDVAILITRKDICSVEGCTTLGVANVGGMCRPDRSCSVNEDNGITLAHTITHELGHNFGMYHDTEKTGCDRRAGSIVHVMTPSFEADTVQVSWSNCSRRYITHFLDQGLGNCLDDYPTEMEVMSYPDLPAGAMYNAELQCRLQFNTTDESVRVCSKIDEICSHLWCLYNDECVTQLRPAAPGTNCGKHKWCQNQKCVPIEEQPAPIDGQWGNWTEYSECSRTCGGGVSISNRECDNPRPENEGAFCLGERIRYKVCNLDPCLDNVPSFRAQQCSKFNNETYHNKKYEWLPYFDSHDPCELYCTDSEDTLIVPWGDNAADGTPCNIGTNDMCIAGICRKVGCDWIVDSNTTEDQCGVCGGNGETCTTIKGEFNKKMNVTDDYFEITRIPTGSRQILVEEIHPSKNYLSVGRTNSNQTFLNGDRLILMPGEFSIDKIKGLYERENEQEKIKIPGPIPFDLTVKVLVRGKSKNPGIRYEYTLSANDTKEPLYYWKLGDWSACSATCDGGIQQREPICYESVKGIVDDDFCWSSAENDLPNKKVRICNEVPCPAHWWVGPWQLCPVTCRKHAQPHPVKRRTIMCVDFKENALSDTSCNNIEERPAETELCDINLPYCSGEEDNNENSNMV